MKIILYSLYVIAFCFGAFSLSLIFDFNPLQVKLEDKGSLLSAVGIIISAFIASFSVVKNIENTNKIEEERKSQKLHSRLDISFYILDKNKVYIRLLEEYTKTDNPLFHKNSIVDILNLSLKNLEKLEQQITVPPVSIARTEVYILEMKFIVDKLPEQRGIKLTKEFKELLENLKGVTENFNKILTEEHCSSSK